MLTNEEMVIRIKEELDQSLVDIKANPVKGDGYWTTNIKMRLGNLGTDMGFSICTSGFKNEFESAWLFDLVWYKEVGTGDNARLVDIPLVVESEWKKDFKHIKYDFEKLLVTNSRLRLFICYVHPDNYEKTHSYFKQAIHVYPLIEKGSSFIIATLSTEDHNYFDYKIYSKT